MKCSVSFQQSERPGGEQSARNAAYAQRGPGQRSGGQRCPPEAPQGDHVVGREGRPAWATSSRLATGQTPLHMSSCPPDTPLLLGHRFSLNHLIPFT